MESGLVLELTPPKVITWMPWKRYTFNVIKKYNKVFKIHYHEILYFLIILYYMCDSFMFYSTNQIATAAVVVVYLEIAHPVGNDEALNQ